MKYVCPLLVVRDMVRARFFYETLLGQTVKMDFGENITFEGDFALHQAEHWETLIEHAEIRYQSRNFELYFEENDLDSLYQKLQTHQVEWVHPIREQPWRQRVMRFYDYDGHIIEVGESLEYTAYRLHQDGLAIAEISRITYLPETAVTEAIQQLEKQE